MDFVKMHGLGNDFVVIDGRRYAADWPRLAVALCDRHFGVGADGFVLVLDSEKADFRKRIYKPDGSEAEMCGNGIRCFAKYVYDEGETRRREVLVETGAGLLPIAIQTDGQGAVVGVTVGMGPPRLRPTEIPVALEGQRALDVPLRLDEGIEVRFSAVSMGNPHAVAFLDQPVESFPLERIGPQVEHHPLFPRRVNFEVCNVLDRRNLHVRVWERGAGLTLACGTGACATVVAARVHDLVDDEVAVRLPGGTLRIAWDGRDEVRMTGPAVTVFRGAWPNGTQ
ncbi:MAG: diaminopimelate epimerase [Chloroflexi bacterium]|nr:diaminopimelate epimerase [Chloroflexota bacterium]